MRLRPWEHLVQGDPEAESRVARCTQPSFVIYPILALNTRGFVRGTRSIESPDWRDQSLPVGADYTERTKDEKGSDMNQLAQVEKDIDLSAIDRDSLRELVDVVIPTNEKFPSASEAAVHTKWIDRGLKVRPDLLGPLLNVLRHCENDLTSDVVARLIELETESIEPVIELIVTCYYMSPKVRKKLDYKGQVPVPILVDETEYYLRDNILDPVSTRPAMWRSTPDDPAGSR